MSKRKNILIISAITTFLAVAFMISFSWGMNMFSDPNNKKAGSTSQPASDIEKAASTLNTEQTVSSSAKVTVKIEYTKSGDIADVAVNTSDFAGKSRAQLENEGYIVESLSVEQVALRKKLESYAPNKYVLGVKDECLVIFKTDNEGNLFIENESTDITDIEVPTPGDYNLLVKGSKYFQFNTREEAEEKLGEYSS